MAFTTEQRVKIIAALENSKYKWRTVSGVAREVATAPDVVKDVIDHSRGLLVQSSIPSTDGAALFTTRRHLRKHGSAFERLMGALKNRAV